MFPTPTGRARARSARARAQPRLKPLAGLRLGTPAPTQSYRLGVLLRGLRSMRSHCSSSCRLLWRSLLSRLPMLSICLQCLTLSSLTRFPFHDSQVSKNLQKCCTVAPEVIVSQFPPPRFRTRASLTRARAARFRTRAAFPESENTVLPHLAKVLAGKKCFKRCKYEGFSVSVKVETCIFTVF